MVEGIEEEEVELRSFIPFCMSMFILRSTGFEKSAESADDIALKNVKSKS